MHLRHPVVLTTVEEDFKAIGLITEADERKSDKKSDKDDQEEVTADKEASVKKGKGEKKEDDARSTDDILAELKQRRLKRHTSSERMKWRRAKKRGGAKSAARKYRKKASVKRMLKRHHMKAKRLRHGKAAGRRRINFGNDTVANMLEDTQELIAGLDETKVENSIKAFANIAIISEMLSHVFGKFAENEETEADDRKHLKAAAAVFGEMAEEAADIARSLKEGKEDEVDFDDLSEVFKAQMSDLLNGLEMYADITEDDDLADLSLGEGGEDDEDDEEDDDEDDEEEKDEAKDDEDDEKDDDDKEGDKKKMPPFMKKGAKGEKKEGKKR